MLSVPEMILYEDRVNSFGGWSKQLRPNKDTLAPAGFFYTGMGDKVKCFACGLEVIDWDPADNPWTEHGKFSGDCLYLKMTGAIVKSKDATTTNPLTSNPFTGANNQQAVIPLTAPPPLFQQPPPPTTTSAPAVDVAPAPPTFGFNTTSTSKTTNYAFPARATAPPPITSVPKPMFGNGFVFNSSPNKQTALFGKPPGNGQDVCGNMPSTTNNSNKQQGVFGINMTGGTNQQQPTSGMFGVKPAVAQPFKF